MLIASLEKSNTLPNHLNKCPGYDAKQFDGKALYLLGATSMGRGQIELFNHLLHLKPVI